MWTVKRKSRRNRLCREAECPVWLSCFAAVLFCARVHDKLQGVGQTLLSAAMNSLADRSVCATSSCNLSYTLCALVTSH